MTTSEEPDKSEIYALFSHHLEEKLAGLLAEQASARRGTRVDGDHRPSNRGERGAVTAQGYLAHGYAQRAQEISEQLRLLRAVQPDQRGRVVTGAVVELMHDDDSSEWVALLPGGDAFAVSWAGREVRVLSPDSPWGRALFGLELDDAADLPPHNTAVEVIAIL